MAVFPKYTTEGCFYNKLVDSLKIALQSSLLEHIVQHLFTNIRYYNVCMYVLETYSNNTKCDYMEMI